MLRLRTLGDGNEPADELKFVTTFDTVSEEQLTNRHLFADQLFGSNAWEPFTPLLFAPHNKLQGARITWL